MKVLKDIRGIDIEVGDTMYVIRISYNGKQTDKYVSMINYTNQNWNSGDKPKVFGTLESAKKCTSKINEWAPNIIFEIYNLMRVL